MNKVMLIGNVAMEPEVRYVDKDVAVARVRLITSERGYTLQNGTQVPERRDGHTILMWRNLAKIVEKYVHKGDKLYVEGRLRYSTYNDKHGVKHNTTEIWADNMEMLSPRPQQDAPAATERPAQQATSQTATNGTGTADGLPF